MIDDSLTQDDLAPDSVGASEVAFNYAGSASEGGAASNADLLDGIDSTAFAVAGHGHDVSQVTNAARLASNTFTATQTIDNGNLDLDDSTATTGLTHQERHAIPAQLRHRQYVPRVLCWELRHDRRQQHGHGIRRARQHHHGR